MFTRPRFHSKFRLSRGENGATVVEYALLIAFIALACVVAITALGQSLKQPFQQAITGLS